MERRQGIKISCVEEIAYRMGFIDKGKLKKLGEVMANNPYGKYLLNILE